LCISVSDPTGVLPEDHVSGDGRSPG
jgi:hypothetical protein